MIKRALSIGIALSLFSFFSLPPSQASVRSGTHCAKAGLTETSAGKKFTCGKSGKKLIWNAGVKTAAVKAPKPAPVVASPTPTPSVPVIADLAIDPSKFGTVAEMARNSISVDAPIQSILAPISYRYEAGIPNANQQLMADGANNFLMHFSNILLETSKPYRLLGYSTLAGGEKLADTYDPSNSTFLDDMKNTFTSKPAPDPTKCNGFGGFSVGYENLIVIDASCPHFTHGSAAIVTHELTHEVQSAVLGGANPGGFVPFWLKEGQAQVVGSAMTYQDATQNPSLSRADWAAAIKSPVTLADLSGMEGPTSDLSEYNRGAAIVEYLIARSGLKKSLEVIHQAGVQVKGREIGGNLTALMSNFQIAFEKVYGQTLGDFYTEVLPYVQYLSTHSPTASADSTETGTKFFLTESCHAYGNATLQRSEGGIWKDVAPAKGWDIAPTPKCAVGTFRPWTIADVAKGSLLRWHVYAIGDWDWYSTPYTY